VGGIVVVGVDVEVAVYVGKTLGIGLGVLGGVEVTVYLGGIVDVRIGVPVPVGVDFIAAWTGTTLTIPLAMAISRKTSETIRALKNIDFSPGEDFPPYRSMLTAISFHIRDVMSRR
jgi:hypothetical protein